MLVSALMFGQFRGLPTSVAKKDTVKREMIYMDWLIRW